MHLKTDLNEKEIKKKTTNHGIYVYLGFPGGSDGKESAFNAGDPGVIPGSGRSPVGGNSNPLQYASRENSMDGGAWWATVRGIAESRTRPKRLTPLPSHMCS